MKLFHALTLSSAIGLGCLIAPVAVTSETGCNAQTFAGIQTAAGPVAQGALDAITCVSDAASVLTGGPSTISDVVSACSRFGVDVYQAYQIIQSLLNNASATPDGGSGAANPALVQHFKALLSTAKKQ